MRHNMSTKKTPCNSSDAQNPMMEFLKGNGPNPIATRRINRLGHLDKDFLNGLDEDIAAEDEANASEPEPTAMEEL